MSLDLIKCYEDELPKELLKYEAVISDFVDDTEYEDGYWVYLKQGWWSPTLDTHLIRRKTLVECAQALEEVERCTKDCCL